MIDLITVVFRDEIAYLLTQAESISLYVPEVNNIYIIVNDDDSVCELIDAAWWKQYQHKVKIIPYSKWNYECRINGWENQQLLKLLAASESLSKWSMVLDAKTWFSQKVDYGKLFDNQERATVGALPPHPVFKSSKNFVEQHYGVTLDKVIGPAGVPFMFHTATVANMVDEFDDFINFFQTNVTYPNRVTEFYLYSAYVLARYGTYEKLYTKQQYYTCCNVAHFDVPQFTEILKRMHSPRILTVSIHRRSYSLLSTDQIKQWITFLASKHLFPQFLNDLTK